jgi:ferredoxin
MKSLAQNFPSAYELLPSVPFVFGSGGAVSLDDTFGIQYSSVVRTSSGTYASGDDTQWTLNENLLTTADDFAANFGTPSAPTPYPNGVKFYAIIGQGVSTVNGYWERPATPKEILDNQYVVLNDKDVVLVPLYGDGDGTVPLWSLALSTATQLYVNPVECIDCGACVPVCPTTSIFVIEELPEDQNSFIEKNAAYYN